MLRLGALVATDKGEDAADCADDGDNTSGTTESDEEN